MTEVTKEQLQELLDFSISFMKKQMADTGSVLPMLHAVKRDGEMAVIATPFTDERSKDAIMTMVRISFLAWDVTHYVQFSEAWVRTFQPDEERTKEIREYEDKREVLTAHAVSEDLILAYCGEIDRDWASGKYTGVKNEDTIVINKKEDDAYRGRMVELLPPPEVRLAYNLLPEDRKKAFVEKMARHFNVSMVRGEEVV